MKQRWIVAAAMLLAVVALGSRWPGRAASTAAKPVAPLGVEALMKQVRQPTGVVTVRGVVSEASSREGRLTLIDAAEAAACGTTTCAELALPVAWSGPLPAVAEHVDATGRVATRDGKLIFVAAKLASVAPAAGSRP